MDEIDQYEVESEVYLDILEGIQSKIAKEKQEIEEKSDRNFCTDLLYQSVTQEEKDRL